MKRVLILLLFSFFIVQTNAQEEYKRLFEEYNRLNTSQKSDSALVKAKAMNMWALKNESDTSFKYAITFKYVGLCFYNLKDIDSCLFYWDKSIEAFQQQGKNEHPEYSYVLYSRGYVLRYLGEFEKAEYDLLLSLEIKRKVFGENSHQCATTINTLGSLYVMDGQYEKAKSFYTKALKLRIEIYGDTNAIVANSLNNLGILNDLIGDYQMAEEYYLGAAKMYKRANGKESPDYARCIGNLGILNIHKGDFEAAEKYLLQSQKLLKSLIGEEDQDYAAMVLNLAVIYQKIGDYKLAERHYKQALQIQKELKMMEPLSASLINLSSCFKDAGLSDSAEIYCDRAAKLVKEIHGSDHPNYARCQSILGDIKLIEGKYDTAEIYFKDAERLRLEIFGEENIVYAASLFDLAVLNVKTRNYEDAERYLLKDMAIEEAAIGKQHPDYLKSEILMVDLLTKTSRQKEAYQVLTDLYSSQSLRIANYFEWLSNSQKELYWRKESGFYDQISWFAHESYKEVPKAAALNYNSALLSKSKLLEAKISQEDYFLEIDELREGLGYRRKYLAKLESDGSEDKELMDKLELEADSLDKRLTLSWPAYAEQKKNLSITWQQVQQKLKEGEVAIEYVRFYHEDDSVVYYNALMLRKNDTLPFLVKLCTEKELKQIDSRRGFSAYYSLIWQPLEPFLDGIKVVYYAPVGELNNVPFNALYSPKKEGDKPKKSNKTKRGAETINNDVDTEEGAEYLLDRFTMHQLTSSRYLAIGLESKQKQGLENSIAMVGGVNYDYLPGIEKSKSSPEKSKKQNRGNRSASKLEYLKGTKEEVENINSSIKKAEWSTILLEKNQPTEENVMKMEGKNAKSILHLATHGYAFPEYDFTDTTVSEKSLMYSYRYSTNPMVRSGLILAGGNWAWTGSDTLQKLGAEQNGILTALEVSQLNLRNTQLVVLSACETGLGLVDASEGTFGLKRGFKLAGVDQIIVSLWTVPDDETKELMTAFYEQLVVTSNPVLSFESAQLQMRNKYPKEPYKWAGFVFVR